MNRERSNDLQAPIRLPSCRSCAGVDACCLAPGDPERREELRKNATAILLPPGEMAFSEGEIPEGAWLVCRGRVSVIKRLPGGDQMTLRVSYPGDLVGYRSLFANQPFQASAVALTRSVLLFLDKAMLEGLMRQSDGASIHMLRKLSRELGHAEAIVTTIDQKEARLRVLRLLWDLRALKGDSKGAKWQRLPLRRHHVSVLAGLPYDVTIGVLNELQSEGYVRMEEKHISVINDGNGLSKNGK